MTGDSGGRLEYFLIGLRRFRRAFLELDWLTRLVAGLFIVGLLFAVLTPVGVFIAWLLGYKSPSEVYYDQVRLQNDVLYASTRRWNKHGLEWLTQSDSGIKLDKEAPIQLSVHSRAFVFVHGHKSPQSQVAAYFSALVDYIRDQNPSHLSFIIYDWPSVEPSWMHALGREESRGDAERVRALTTHRPWAFGDHQAIWTRSSYDVDRQYAEGVGVDGFVSLLKTLQASGITNATVIAHSMGCHLVAEVIRRQSAALIPGTTIAFLAPDVPARIFEDVVFLRSLASVHHLHVFFSKDDQVLGIASVHANWARRLGAIGPREGSRLPSNVTLHDVTDRIALLPGTHSAYVRRDGAAKIDLHGVLTRSVETESTSR